MEITYERKHNESYMVLEGRLDESSYETKMIRENKIDSLVEVNGFVIDGKSKLSYKISRMETIEDFIDATDLSLDIITRLVINIKLGLDEIDRYLIDENHLLINKETLYIKKGEGYQVSICYYPNDNGSIQEQFRGLMEYIVTKMSFEDRLSARQIYSAYDLCLKDDYTLEEIIECLQYKEEQEKDIYVEEVSLEEDKIVDETCNELDSSDYFYNDIENDKTGIVSKIIEAAHGIFGRFRFEDISEDKRDMDFEIDPEYELEEKTVLLTEAKPVGRLIYDGTSNEDDFMINKEVFRIGSSKNCDAILKAKTVSSNHAKIIREGGDFYLSDSNSLNGSFLNSVPLVYKKPYKLKPMDSIRFASESYIFM